VRGNKPGSTTATIKYFVPAKGKTPAERVVGTLQIHVSDKRAKKKRIKEQWTSLGKALGIVILNEDASMDEPMTGEPISFNPCGASDLTVYSSFNVGGIIGDDIIGTGTGLDIGLRLPVSRITDHNPLGEYGEGLYLTGGIGFNNYGSSDDYIDDITGWRLFGGVGLDVFLVESVIGGCCLSMLPAPLPVCWGWGVEGLLEFGSLTAKNDYADESASSLGLRFKTGPRLKIRDSGWRAELNAGGSFQLTDYDFGYNTDTGRFGYQIDFGVGYGF
jgi:hypothetical protein